MLDPSTANRRSVGLLLGVLIVVVASIGLVVDLLVGVLPIITIVALVVGGAIATRAYLRADRWVLSAIGAVPADADHHQRLHNLVEGLCLANGLPKPAVYVVEDPAPNSCAVGRTARNAGLVVTTGLLDLLNRVELEGVVAHELAHIRSGDTVKSDTAALVLGVPARVLPPVFLPLLERVVSDDRESFADLSGCRMTRYPPGLVSALEKLRDEGRPLRVTSPATAHLWLVDPDGPGADESASSRHPVEERIALLREL